MECRIKIEITYLLIRRSRGLPEKVTCPQLLKKFPAFPEASLPHSQQSVAYPYPEPAQSNPCSYPTSWISILTISSLKFSPPKLCMHLSSPFPNRCHMPPPPLHSWLDHPNNIWWGVQSIKLLVMQSSPLPCYLVPLGPKYPPQRSILENPQPTFLRQCQWPSFTTIKKEEAKL